MSSLAVRGWTLSVTRPGPRVEAPRISLQDWFTQECEARREAWRRKLNKTRQRLNAERVRSVSAAEFLAGNAREDLDRIEIEVGSLTARSVGMLSAAAILLAVPSAVYGFSPSHWATLIVLAVALALTTLSSTSTLLTMRSSFRGAWKEKYEKSDEWSLLMTSFFEKWVMHCYLADRRKAIATKYKRAHSIAIPALVAATIVVTVGLPLSFLVR